MPENADRKLYLTADRERVVEEGDDDAAFLFKGEGDEITDEEAKQYGISARKEEQTEPAQKARQSPEAATEADTAEAREAKQPTDAKQAQAAANKARTTRADK
jgi:hypothetical protein